MLDGTTTSPQWLGNNLASTSALNSIDQLATEEIQKLGKEFEGVFLSLLLKEMRNTVEGGLFPEDPSDSLGGLFDLHLGNHLSDSAPIGIAKVMMQAYENQQGSSLSNEANSSDKKNASSKPVDIKG